MLKYIGQSYVTFILLNVFFKKWPPFQKLLNNNHKFNQHIHLFITKDSYIQLN